MRAPINYEEPRGAGDAFIESRRDAIYYIDGGASIYLGASRLYIWARHEINAIYCVVPRQNIDAQNIDVRAQI